MPVRNGGLRHADKERLGMVVAALQSGGHFAIVVIAQEVSFSPAKVFLEHELGEAAMGTFELRTDDEVMRMFASPQAHEDVLVFLRLAKDGDSAMAALNLHRDKLRSRPCRFVLWLDGVEGQARFADRAPDCYSVREALAFVEGQKTWNVPVELGTDEVGTGTMSRRVPDLHSRRVSVPHPLVLHARDALLRCDIRLARKSFSTIPPHWWQSRLNQFYKDELDAKLLGHEGHWEQAEAVLQEMLDEAIQDKHRLWVDLILLELASLLADRAEFDEALGRLNLLHVTTSREKLLRLSIELQCANPEAIASLRGPLVDKLPNIEKDLKSILKLAQAKAEGIHACVDAGLLPPAREEEMVAEVDKLDAHVQTTLSEELCIEAALLSADVRLARRGTEKEACVKANHALVLARDGAPAMIPLCLRRMGLAMLRTGDDLSSLDALLAEALAAANENDLVAEAVRLHGLRLWLAHRRSEDLAEREEALESSFQRCGSVLVEAEVLYQIGRGMNRPDLLERARRIYRRLPWPAREVACLEALGKTDMAKTRCEQFGLRLLLLTLERRTEPSPIGP